MPEINPLISMPNAPITRKGRYRLTRNGEFVSQHNQLIEAYEHAEPGDFIEPPTGWEVGEVLLKLTQSAPPPVPPDEVGFVLAAVTVNESEGTLNLSVARVGAATDALTVTFTTIDGTALDGVNYDESTGTLEWADLESDTKNIAVTIIDIPLEAQGTKVFTVDLNITVGDESFTNEVVTVTIQDNGLANNPVYPMLGIYWLSPHAPFGGFEGQYQSEGGQEWMRRCNLVIMNGWPELAATRVDDVQNETIAAAVKLDNTKNPEVRIYMYFDFDSVLKSGTANATEQTKIAAENWYVYETGTSGTPLDSWFSSSLYSVNGTTFAPDDSGGLNASEWKVQHHASWIFGGAESNDAAPSINGIFCDNYNRRPRRDGDWNRDGTEDDDRAEETGQWLRDGLTTGIDHYRSIHPTKTVIANTTEFGVVDDPSVDMPEYVDQVDGGIMEDAMGETFSIETFMTTADFVSHVRQHQDSVLDPNYIAFHCKPEDDDAGNFRLLRHAMTACLVLTDCSFAYSIANLANWPHFDEYDFNLGTASEDRQATAEENSIWRRDFQHGIALWCPKSITGTITLGGTFYVLRGDAAGFLTPGDSVTSVTFSTARNGLILSRTAT